MKALSIIFYIIGSVLLIVSCFTSSVVATWWLGSAAVVTLVAGCVFQYMASRRNHSLY